MTLYLKPELRLVGHAAALVLGAKTIGTGESTQPHLHSNFPGELSCDLGLDD